MTETRRPKPIVSVPKASPETVSSTQIRSEQLYVKIVSLESWGVSVSGSKNFERDAFYAWLISPEVAQAEIARERGGI